MPDTAIRNEDLHAADRAYFLHPSTDAHRHAIGASPNRIITGGKGIRIVDSEGKESIDGFAGLYCVNVGYGRQEIAKAIARQAEELAYFHAYAGHASEPAIRLAERIIEKAPDGMKRVYFGMSGSDANETQIKLVWYYNNVLARPQKKKIISRWRGYHGSGIMTGSLTGLKLFHDLFDLPRAPVLHTLTPHYYWGAEPGESEAAFVRRCADELERMIVREGPETVAAFIGEPVLGTGGIVPPPVGYWDAIQKVLARYDVLLIADEVITGFGRTGRWFGSDLYGMRPDLITIAKGLSSAYLPISGVIVGEKVWQVLDQGAEKLGAIGHGWTYSAHPLCAAAALANLDIIEREKLVDNAREVGAHFQRLLHEAFDGHKMVGEVRGVGLLAAVEFVADRAARKRFDAKEAVGARIAAACLARGLIARAMPQGDILGFAPPLVVTREEADEIVGIARAALDDVANERSVPPR